MDDPTPRDLDAITAEPEQLDGHTIDELADYLDNDRSPLDPSIEQSPACRHALAALARLRAVSAELLTDPADDTGSSDDAWIDGILARISADAHAGADFLIHQTDAGDEIVMTEGALRALIRAAGDGKPGFLVGRIRFTGDLAAPTGTTISVDVTVAHGTVIPAAITGLRAAILDQVRRHTRMQHLQIDITVQDITGPASSQDTA